MRRILLGFALVLFSLATQAGVLFVGDFEPPTASAPFPRIDGQFQLPDYPAANQLRWILNELRVGETTTAEEINARFSPAFVTAITVQGFQDFFETLRGNYPGAVLTDVVFVTPVQLAVVIQRAGGSGQLGYLFLDTQFSGEQFIVGFSVNPYFGSVQFAEDQALTLEQALDKAGTLAAESSLLVARVTAPDQCTVLSGRRATTPRATGSIFKVWVLAGVARAVANGTVFDDDLVALIAGELARGGIINREPLGTLFTVVDLAVLMLGISDNTATDLLHELVGRELIGQELIASGFGDPSLMLPFLGISEQFHLFYSFPLADSLSYVNGSQGFREAFLANQIEPLGSLTDGPFPFFHVQLLADGSWRASPIDVCRIFAYLRELPNGSDALRLVEAALGASAAQPEVRNRWDRVWFKGGSLASGAGNHVLTFAWMLERNGEDPYVVVAMLNDPNGGIEIFPLQSVTARILELIADGP